VKTTFTACTLNTAVANSSWENLKFKIKNKSLRLPRTLKLEDGWNTESVSDGVTEVGEVIYNTIFGCIDHLFVKKDFRNKGVGTYILNYLENILFEKTDCIFVVSHGNAEYFWTKKGYKLVYSIHQIDEPRKYFIKLKSWKK
jgi:hypothetical protein